MFFSPQGIGGTVDLVDRLFVLIPLGESLGLLTERNLTEGNVSTCGNGSEQVVPRKINFCEDDCGPATLDVLLLRTPEANNWLSATWGWLSEWVLLVEGNNINLAFANSEIPNKRVSVTPINYTPEFQWSANQFIDLKIDSDLNSISNSATAQNLMNTYRADIIVLLTNNNYTGNISTGGSGTIFGKANSLDPFSTNKFCITQVANIDPTRFTFMANNAGNNTRIPNYSNPDVFFGGVATGNVGTRNNAKQIRGAFCESANNNPDPQFSVIFSKSSVGPISIGEVHTFSSTIIQGDCIEPFGLIPSVNFGVWPYQYEWRLSTNPNFTNSQIIGTSANVTLTITSCPFYLRLTVTSSNGLTTTATRMYNCSSYAACNRNNPNLLDENKAKTSNFQAIPNPATNEITIVGTDVEHIIDIQCFNLQGSEISTSFFRENGIGRIMITGLTLSPGLYLFRISGKESNEVIKVMIQ